MNGSLASFRELKGIGAATEARLHEAGIYTWDALAAAAAALAAVRGQGDSLRDVAALVARRGEAGADRAAGAERHEAFVLRLALTAEGVPRRSSITHVRTTEEEVWPGFDPDGVIHFVTRGAGIPQIPRPAPTPGPPGNAEAGRHRPSGDGVVEIDLGHEIGGAPRDVDLGIGGGGPRGPGPLGPGCEFVAVLEARPLGAPPDQASATLGTVSGRSDGPGDLRLHFADVRPDPGVQHLRLRLTLRPAGDGTRRALKLTERRTRVTGEAWSPAGSA